MFERYFKNLRWWEFLAATAAGFLTGWGTALAQGQRSREALGAGVPAAILAAAAYLRNPKALEWRRPEEGGGE